MKKAAWCAFAIIVAAALILPRMRLWPNPWPATAWQSFNSWGDAWVLPARPSGAYMIYLAYYKKNGGRVDSETRRTDLKLTVIDETDDKVVPLARDWEHGEIGPNKDWQIEQVANVRLTEGHRYRIEIDPEQLKYLAEYRHRLGVDLDVSEKANWNRRRNDHTQQAPERRP